VRFGDLAQHEHLFACNLEQVLRFARESRLVQFHGDTLDRCKDNTLVIRLTRRNREIQHYYCDTGHLLPNSNEGNLWLDTDSARRHHYTWVTNVREVGMRYLSLLTSLCQVIIITNIYTVSGNNDY